MVLGVDVAYWTELPVAGSLVLILLGLLTPKGRRGVKKLSRALDIIDQELVENGGSSVKDVVSQVEAKTTANHDILQGVQDSVSRIENNVNRAHTRIDGLHERVDGLAERREWRSD